MRMRDAGFSRLKRGPPAGSIQLAGYKVRAGSRRPSPTAARGGRVEGTDRPAEATAWVHMGVEKGVGGGVPQSVGAAAASPLALCNDPSAGSPTERFLLLPPGSPRGPDYILSIAAEAATPIAT